MLSVLSVPFFLDAVKAGFPSPAADYTDSSLDFNQLLVKNPPATFCLRVAGDSMKEAGIYPGDMVVVNRSLRPCHRDVVVAEVEGEFTLKRLLIRPGGELCLHPENDLYPDLIFSEQQELSIFGVVTAVIRQLKT